MIALVRYFLRVWGISYLYRTIVRIPIESGHPFRLKADSVPIESGQRSDRKRTRVEG